MNEDVFDNLLKSEMRGIRYGKQVDLVPAVMDRICTMAFAPVRPAWWQRPKYYLTGSVAACVAVLIVVGALRYAGRFEPETYSLMNDVSHYMETYCDHQEASATRFSTIETLILDEDNTHNPQTLEEESIL